MTAFDAPLPTAAPKATRRWLRAATSAQRGLVSWAAILLVTGTVAGLASPRLLGAVVDVVARHGRRSTVDRLALLLLLAALLEAALTATARLLLARVGENELASLRRSTLERALSLPTETIERAGTGDLIARCTTDVSLLTDITREVLPWVISAALLATFTIGALLFASPLLALTALAGTPVSVAATLRYLRRAGMVYRREREADAGLVQHLVETCDGARVLRTYRQSGDQQRRVSSATAALLGAQAAGIRIRTRFFPGLAVGQGISLATTVGVGAVLARHGALSTGEVTAGALYVARLYDPLALLLEVLDQLQSAQASLARLVGVLEAPLSSEGGRSIDLPTAPVGLDAARLRFAYADGPDVVSGVDLAVEPRSRVVVVGPSGAGKSTIAALLAAIVEPREGAVSIAGENLATVRTRDRRRLVALVNQEPHVFSGSIEWNVAMVAPTPAVDVRACLDDVGASWVAALPLGMKTVVGPGGHRLTPAQAQQVALARLIAADPAVVILDEATADLSAGAAGAVEEKLSAALADRTVIAIAHRLDPAAGADRVVVVEDGRISETGTHASLVDSGGAYARLWAAWNEAR